MSLEHRNFLQVQGMQEPFVHRDAGGNTVRQCTSVRDRCEGEGVKVGKPCWGRYKQNIMTEICSNTTFLKLIFSGWCGKDKEDYS